MSACRKWVWKSKVTKYTWVFKHEQVFRHCSFPLCGFVVPRKRELSKRADLWELREQLNQEWWKFSFYLLGTSTSKIYFGSCSEMQIWSNFLWNVNPKYNIFVTMFIFSKLCVFSFICICILYNIMYNYWLVKKYRSKAIRKILKSSVNKIIAFQTNAVLKMLFGRLSNFVSLCFLSAEFFYTLSILWKKRHFQMEKSFRWRVSDKLLPDKFTKWYQNGLS